MFLIHVEQVWFFLEAGRLQIGDLLLGVFLCGIDRSSKPGDDRICQSKLRNICVILNVLVLALNVAMSSRSFGLLIAQAAGYRNSSIAEF